MFPAAVRAVGECVARLEGLAKGPQMGSYGIGMQLLRE